MSKTTNITSTISFDEEKLATLNVYLSQQNLSLDTMLTAVLSETIEKAFIKNVPQAVQIFISLKNGIDIQKEVESKSKPPKRDKKDRSFGEQEQTFSLSEPVQNVI
jgi:hypothetical protein